MLGAKKACQQEFGVLGCSGIALWCWNAKVSKSDPESMDWVPLPDWAVEDLMIFSAFVDQQNGVALFPQFQQKILRQCLSSDAARGDAKAPCAELVWGGCLVDIGGHGRQREAKSVR